MSFRGDTKSCWSLLVTVQGKYRFHTLDDKIFITLEVVVDYRKNLCAEDADALLAEEGQ